MKSIISGAFIATAIVACLTLTVQARPTDPSATIAVSDTGKMAKDKMKMDKKMDKMSKDSRKMSKKKMDKMSKDKMKMDKKKMAKDTAGKM